MKAKLTWIAIYTCCAVIGTALALGTIAFLR